MRHVEDAAAGIALVMLLGFILYATVDGINWAAQLVLDHFDHYH